MTNLKFPLDDVVLNRLIKEHEVDLNDIGIRELKRLVDDLAEQYKVDFLPKVKLEIAIAEEDVDKAIEAISTAANTGKIGDGKIFVSSIEQAIRIRTGESGDDAL